MTIDPTEIEDREGLTLFLEGKTDQDIDEAAKAVGSDKILVKVFRTMERDYDPQNGPTELVVVQWDVKVPEGTVQSWQLTVDTERCVAEESAAAKPDIILSMGTATFLKVVAGQLSGIKALSTGKLKLKGDLMLATSIDAWFVR